MYFTHYLKYFLFCFFLLISFRPKHLVFSVNTGRSDTENFEGLIKRVKKGLNTFTDCSVDKLLQHCDKETAKNFECFRSLGECISMSFRTAFTKQETHEQDKEEEQSDEL